MLLTAAFATAQVEEIADYWDIRYNNRPVVIEGYASWCRPCHMYAPIFERVAREYEGRVDFYRIDVDNSEAADFNSDFDVNSVPVTVFLWDPLGDATMKRSVQFGLMGYDELKAHVELALSKHYTNVRPEPSITDQVDYSSTPILTSWPEVPEDGKMPYYPDSNISQYLGTWVGKEDGDDSIINFWEEDGRIYCSAATNAPHRLAVYSTPYWWVGAYRWERKYNAIWLSDVISATSRDYSDSSQILYGLYRDKILRIEGDDLVVSVKEYKDWSNWNNHIVNREFTCRYRKKQL